MHLLRSKWPAAKAQRGSDIVAYRNRGATLAPGHFHRNPSGRGNFGVFLRYSLGQYRNGYFRFARALKNTKIPSGKCIDIYQSAH